MGGQRIIPFLSSTIVAHIERQMDKTCDYNTRDSLFYYTNRVLASVGTNLFVNYSYV